jgi:hypothetical protein
MNSQNKIAAGPTSDTFKWWLSATPSEVRISDDMIDRFIRAVGPATVEEIEAFARGVALTQLLKNEHALMQAAVKAHSLLQDKRDDSEETLQSGAAANWYQTRGLAIETGLVRARELLGLAQDGPWESAIQQFSFYLDIYRDSSTQEHLRDEVKKNKLEFLTKKCRKL